MSNVSLDSATVEWNSLRPMGSDSIVYCLQLQHSHGADHEYKTVRLRSVGSRLHRFPPDRVFLPDASENKPDRFMGLCRMFVFLSNPQFGTSVFLSDIPWQ